MMELFQQLKRRIKNLLYGRKEMAANLAYDLWAPSYDHQPQNLVVYVNEIIFDEMMATIDMQNKIVVDIGCGTGKHWKKILSKKPAGLIGYDVSQEMLVQLRKKYPGAKAFISNNNHLNELADKSCDVIISTLVIGHIADLAKTFLEWNRVLKNNGNILITDFHPEMLSKGASRSFQHNNAFVSIKTYKHTIPQISQLAKSLNWELVNITEKRIDDSVKHFFRGPQSIEVFENSINAPLVFGSHFKKIG
jgi:ubiquinone/menaquinone biosynthesis C-methylase UbiE